MLEITDLAVKNVKDYLSQNNIADSAIRISMMSGGCSGPSLSLSLDEAKDSDVTVEKDGVSFIMEKGLSEVCGAVKVDFIESNGGGCGCSGGGFTITSEKPLPGAGGGCGSCSSCG